MTRSVNPRTSPPPEPAGTVVAHALPRSEPPAAAATSLGHAPSAPDTIHGSAAIADAAPAGTPTTAGALLARNGRDQPWDPRETGGALPAPLAHEPHAAVAPDTATAHAEPPPPVLLADASASSVASRSGERQQPPAPAAQPLPAEPENPSDVPCEGVRLGRFELIDELSRTANSVVYRARQLDLHGRLVALKVLVDAGPEYEVDDRVSRFQREVENSAKLRHPNIVSLFEVGEVEGFTYFAMELVEGCSLAEWLAAYGPMNGHEAAELMIKVARAIHYAHTRGIIHRDIKPGNILLDRLHGEPMVADFGLAKDIRSDIRITQSGITVGTPPYMPPEQARGQHDLLDSRSDVYALGATLYEMVTGRPPFDGETGIQVMMRVLGGSRQASRRTLRRSS